MSLHKFLSKLGHSLGKRLFWAEHLEEAARDLDALRVQLPTRSMLLTLPLLFRGAGHYRTLGLKQNLVEFEAFVEYLQPDSFSTVLEIGTMKGGTLYLWCQLCRPDAHVLSIDLPSGRFGGGYTSKLELLFHRFKQKAQTLTCIRGDSHAASTLKEFKSRLNGRMLDFLFIDGDHTYDGVRRDFEDYAPFVRTGGVIAFHDIVFNPLNAADFEVWRFWDEIKKQHSDAVEFIEPQNSQRRTIGIGAIRKKDINRVQTGA